MIVDCHAHHATVPASRDDRRAPRGAAIAAQGEFEPVHPGTSDDGNHEAIDAQPKAGGL